MVRAPSTYGVFRLDGSPVIPVIYDRIDQQTGSIFLASKGGLMGAIDSAGRVLIPCEWDKIQLATDQEPGGGVPMPAFAARSVNPGVASHTEFERIPGTPFAKLSLSSYDSCIVNPDMQIITRFRGYDQLSLFTVQGRDDRYLILNSNSIYTCVSINKQRVLWRSSLFTRHQTRWAMIGYGLAGLLIMSQFLRQLGNMSQEIKDAPA